MGAQRRGSGGCGEQCPQCQWDGRAAAGTAGEKLGCMGVQGGQSEGARYSMSADGTSPWAQPGGSFSASPGLAHLQNRIDPFPSAWARQRSPAPVRRLKCPKPSDLETARAAPGIWSLQPGGFCSQRSPQDWGPSRNRAFPGTWPELPSLRGSSVLRGCGLLFLPLSEGCWCQ